MEERIVTKFSDIEGVLEELCIHLYSGESWETNRNRFLFRGQSQASHPIASTLERVGKGDISFYEYYQQVSSVLPLIQSMTGLSFNLEPIEKIKNWYRDFSNVGGEHKLLSVELLAFMRHHGFPSPLIDWSRSPYVALYFACSNEREKDGALWTYQEFVYDGKSVTNWHPMVVRVGHNFVTHERHQRQQGDYLIACFHDSKESSKNGIWKFVPFQCMYKRQFEERVGQDQLCKVIIKAEAKIPILKRLDAMNINAYSLYNSVDALMETEKFRLFDFNK